MKRLAGCALDLAIEGLAWLALLLGALSVLFTKMTVPSL